MLFPKTENRIPNTIFILTLALLFILALCFFLLPPESKKPSHPAGTPQPSLESYFNNRDAYEESFARFPNLKKFKVRAGIVTHHFLAKDLMAEFFQGIDPRGIRRVILAGPDHYKIYPRKDCLGFTTLLPWNTPFGPISPDKIFIDHLVREAGFIAHDRIFMREHGVYILTPFIKKAFPDAALIPLILQNHSPYDRLIALGRDLRRQGGDDTLLVVSSDFAHRATSEEAERLDRQSLSRLESLQKDGVGKITSDCRPGLAVLLGFLGDETPRFHLINHKTSLDFGSPEAGNLTSYLTGYYLKEPQPRASLLFLGDLMFDRHIRRVAARKGHDFILAEVGEFLRDHDLVVANLEGPITDAPPVSLDAKWNEPRHYAFTFDKDLAPALKRHGITLVNLGNNHILDFGPEGLEATRRYLDLAGVEHFGDPPAGGPRFLIKQINGIKVGLLNYNQFSARDLSDTLSDLRTLRSRADLVMVYAHWGLEYGKTPGEDQIETAHALIDHGADLIIGSHPHVIQEKEIYRGKRIYYSLGNFIFDQYFRPATRRGLAVKVAIDPKDLGLSFQEFRLIMDRSGQTKVENKLD